MLHAWCCEAGWTSSIYAVKPSFLDAARDYGFGDEIYDEAFRYDDPLTALSSGEEVVFVEVHSAAHQLFDMDGLPFPVGLIFNYIDGGMSEDRYDLVKASEILMKRKDVLLLPGGGESRSSGPQDDPRSYVGAIPYYNTAAGRRSCLQFHWRASVEDYRRVWALALEDRSHPGKGDLMKACFDLDIFGLRAGGAARFEDYYDTARYENEDSDDDYDD